MNHVTTYDDLIEMQDRAIANMIEEPVTTYDDLIEMQDRAIEDLLNMREAA